MIKRIMYFYDKKQADLIKKVNDKLHRQRGVHIKDISIKNIDAASVPDDIVKKIYTLEDDITKACAKLIKNFRLSENALKRSPEYINFKEPFVKGNTLLLAIPTYTKAGKIKELIDSVNRLGKILDDIGRNNFNERVSLDYSIISRSAKELQAVYNKYN